MKTRIISGIVMALITLAFIIAGLKINLLFIALYIMAVAAIGVYEMIKNAAGIKSKVALYGSVLFSVAFVFIALALRRLALELEFLKFFAIRKNTMLQAACFAYFFFAVIVILACHKEFDLGKILAFTFGVPMLSLAFCFIAGLMNIKNGIYYILLLVAFSNGCDMGAYFTGVTFGKHKLCPEISPKKTVEGAIGGVVTSIILAVVIVLILGSKIGVAGKRFVYTAVLAIPLCIIGMLGDLFFSAIKRSVGIKDYGNLIPGHGGILDRFDSILFISPVLYAFAVRGII